MKIECTVEELKEMIRDNVNLKQKNEIKLPMLNFTGKGVQIKKD